MERGQAERSEAGGEVNPRITKDFPELAETQGTRRRTNTIFSLRLSGALLPQKRDTPARYMDIPKLSEFPGQRAGKSKRPVTLTPQAANMDVSAVVCWLLRPA